MAVSTEPASERKGFFARHLEGATAVISPAAKTYVYEAPLRLWHWVNALCIVVLVITGYLIGKPLPSITGEASYHYLFGYIRMAHFIAGQILAVFMIYRIFWAFVGNSRSRQIFLPPLWSGRWWKELWHEIRYYTFFTKESKFYYGHNPLSQLAMFTLFVLPAINAIITGFALYAEGQGTTSWWYGAFGWVIALYGNSFVVHTVHRLSMWVIVVFSLIHIYLSIREEIMGRVSMVSTIISGWRFFRGDDE